MNKELALQIACILEENKGKQTVVLDLSKLCSFTDFFVITTVQSTAHLLGLVRKIEEHMKTLSKKPLNSAQHIGSGDWVLLDYADIIVHLQSEHGRQFYELETLWYEAGKIFSGAVQKV